MCIRDRPDVEVDYEYTGDTNADYVMQYDVQLQKAIEVMNEKLKRILHLSALVKGYGHGLGKIVDFLNDTCISVSYTHLYCASTGVFVRSAL